MTIGLFSPKNVNLNINQITKFKVKTTLKRMKLTTLESRSPNIKALAGIIVKAANVAQNKQRSDSMMKRIKKRKFKENEEFKNLKGFIKPQLKVQNNDIPNFDFNKRQLK